MITPRSSPACNSSRALPSPSPSPTVLPSHEYDPTGDADLVLYSNYSSDLDSPSSASLSSSSSSVDDGHTDDKETSSAPELELVEFYVHSNVISLASPLFKEMLSSSSALNFNRSTELAQRQSPPPLTPRRIPLPVRPHVLSVLLRFIYPLPDPEVASLDDLVPVLSAAVKYELTGVINALRKQLMLPGKFLEEDPVRVFAIAARFKVSLF
jgi:hypothetical protein